MNKTINDKIGKTENKGFTLVEMIVTIAIIAILVGAAAWGVTSWVAHYAYVSSEEKAKTIYLAAQSALSAKESRGTLDSYIASLRKTMGGDGDGTNSNIFSQVDQSVPDDEDEAEYKKRFEGENPQLEKSLYSIPSDTDNEGNEHEYGYLAVKAGDYGAGVSSAEEKALFDLLTDYISDKEVLNGSILIEFDLTAGKVYSVFYSEWATSIEYLPNSLSNDKSHSKERGIYYIYYDKNNPSNDARRPEEREDFAVGYYASDQVNVISFAATTTVNVKEGMLHNKEMLYLSMYSDSELNDTDTCFEVTLYRKGDTDTKICTFSVSKYKADGTVLAYGESRVDDIKVTLCDGTTFKNGKKEEKLPFVVFCEKSESDDSRDVLCVALDAVMTSQSMALLDIVDSKDDKTDYRGFSITRLLGTDPCDIYATVSVYGGDNADISYTSGDEQTSEIENALFAEKVAGSGNANDPQGYKIGFIRHLSNIRYLEDVASDTDKYEYQLSADLDYSKARIYDRLGGGYVGAYEPADLSITGFPTISVLNMGSTFDGNGHAIKNLLLNNKSAVEYAHTADGAWDSNAAVENRCKTVGLFGRNNGVIRKLKFENADLSLGAKSAENTDESIFSDNVEAAGILCARCNGDIKNIDFDKNCSVDAAVFMKQDDIAEAAADGLDITNVAVLKNLNKKYACGVGMVAGTVVLNDGKRVDKIYTAGTVTGRLNDTQDTPAVGEEAARSAIYDETNADKYAYGTGGVFGYVYGDATTTSEPAVGMASDSYISVINRADVTGTSFTGGIAGGFYISGLDTRVTLGSDDEGDRTIPENAVVSLVNCANYGDTAGVDFVGGIVGVNSKYTYILSCNSYGSPSADGGVSAGITSENYGFIDKCGVDRAPADDYNNGDHYIPEIKGNMQVAGSITSVNHEDSVIRDCVCAVADVTGTNSHILVKSNDVDTFGYLVGKNFGVVNGGNVGSFIGYSSKKTKMVIGGAVGSNYKTVKNLRITSALSDDGEAEVIGGICGANYGNIKKCYFGGKIEKHKGISVDVAIGGIAGINGDGKGLCTVTDCYVCGAEFDVEGKCDYLGTDNEDKRLAKSSAVGGICAINRDGSGISNCHVTCLAKVDGSDNVQTYSGGALNGIVIPDKQCVMNVKYGIAGGIAGKNFGIVRDCGYTDKIFYEKDGDIVPAADNADLDDMTLAKTAMDRVADIAEGNSTIDSDKIKELSKLLINDDTGKLTAAANKLCGYLTYDESKTQYALPKEPLSSAYVPGGAAAYDGSSNELVISMNKGKGSIGGIVGFNSTEGTVKNCASGRWLVENYKPKAKCISTGGVIGMNSANGNRVSENINFAYVRNELPAALYNDLETDMCRVTTDTKEKNNRFYYVGGVIGEQHNTKTTTWELSSCVNVGTVLNYYGNNTGGVVCKVVGCGGTIQYCYNYGTLLSGYSTALLSGYSGTAGGVVSHYAELQSGQTNNVLHCGNFGVVGMAAQGLDPKENKRVNRLANMMSNDVGGVIGEISAPNSKRLYTVNVKDCVNGKTARVYGHSQTGCVVGIVGCYANEDGQITKTVDSIFVNIDSCRNYSSQIWDCKDTKSDGAKLTHGGAGILAQRTAYSNVNTAIGYTTIRNCFSILMTGYTSSGWLNGTKGGRIARSVKASENDFKKTVKYSGNNYFMDEPSFQYYTAKTLHTNGTLSGGSNIGGNAGYILSFANDSSPSNAGSLDFNADNRITDTRNAVDKEVGATRLAVVGYGDDQYALIEEPYGYLMKDMTVQNTWKGGNNICFTGKIGTETQTIKCPIIYSFKEKGSATPYSINLLDHFNYERERNEGNYSDKKSRSPYADEYDLDYYALDKAVVEYISNATEGKGPDIVKNLSVKKNENEGNYLASWTVEAATEGEKPTATAFDVEIRIVKLSNGTAFVPSDVENYKVVDRQKVTAYGTTMGFNTPSDPVMDPNSTYYAVVRARDIRAGRLSETEANAMYSQILKDHNVDGKTISSFIKIEKKLPTPQFEIIAYEGKWQIHLLNGKDFSGYAGLSNFEVGVCELNNDGTLNISKRVKMTAADLCAASGGTAADKLLNDSKECTIFATGKSDHVLGGYAKATGCLDSDIYTFTVYVPSAFDPDIEYELEETENGLNSKKKPYYTGVLNYYTFDSETREEPPVAQIFRVELYGVKKETDEQGKETIWHETLAYKDYALMQGESAEVDVGYYDASSNIKFNEYESFGIDVKYYSPGQGDVYNCIEVSEAQGAKKTRDTGFITDHTGDTVLYRYYPKEMKIRVVCMDRTPSWYVVLGNPVDYIGKNVLVKFNVSKNGKAYQTIDLNAPADVNGVKMYATKVDQTGWTFSGTKISYLVEDLDTNESSSLAYYGLSNTDLKLQINLYSGITVSFTDLTGSYASDTNIFDGTLYYKSHENIIQYCRYEIYGRDVSGNSVTLWLSGDEALEAKGTDDAPHSKSIHIDLSDRDLSAYTDLTFAVWYSKSKLYTSNDTTGRFLYQYIKISEENAKEIAATRYDAATATFSDTRSTGLLILDEGRGTKTYYYVAALKDKLNYSDSTYCLYREINLH